MELNNCRESSSCHSVSHQIHPVVCPFTKSKTIFKSFRLHYLPEECWQEKVILINRKNRYLPSGIANPTNALPAINSNMANTSNDNLKLTC